MRTSGMRLLAWWKRSWLLMRWMGLIEIPVRWCSLYATLKVTIHFKRKIFRLSKSKINPFKNCPLTRLQISEMWMLAPYPKQRCSMIAIKERKIQIRMLGKKKWWRWIIVLRKCKQLRSLSMSRLQRRASYSLWMKKQLLEGLQPTLQCRAQRIFILKKMFKS